MTNNLDAARRRLEELRAEGAVPTAERLSPTEKAQRNPTSLRTAITAMCWVCQGEDADPHPRWRIGNCQITTCPLYPVRPWQNQHGRPVPQSLQTDQAD